MTLAGLRTNATAPLGMSGRPKGSDPRGPVSDHQHPLSWSKVNTRFGRANGIERLSARDA